MRFKKRLSLLTGHLIQVLAAFFCVAFITAETRANERNELVIHAAEIGIGKFHRYDNQMHPYGEKNIWSGFALPEGASTRTPLIRANADGSVSIFFSHLEELIQQIQKITDERKTKVGVLNINAHGMPGAMWFPKDEVTMNGTSCSDWVKAANGEDKANYEQYYSPVARTDIVVFRVLSKLPSMQFTAPCTTGAPQWKEILNRNRGVRKSFANDAQLHLFSCIVGLGASGKKFSTNLAALLFEGNDAKLEASMNFGLGDWSMPEGMGFWDYQNSDQLKRDNAKYPINRQDREVMQKGEIRLVTHQDGKWQDGIVGNLDFMFGSRDSLSLANAQLVLDLAEPKADLSKIAILQDLISSKKLQVHIPGTIAPIEFPLQ